MKFVIVSSFVTRALSTGWCSWLRETRGMLTEGGGWRGIAVK
jgi:hypothetical protein